ncbi:MAG: GtrA family protein [Betaproteobacteria bacterium]
MNSIRLLRFALVGAVGFVVDAGVLTAMLGSVTPSVYAARAVSFSVAVLVTWLLNRRFVFGPTQRQHAGAEYLRYLVTQVIGALTNLAVFFTLVAAFPVLTGRPVVPLAAGAVLGAIVNYWGSTLWVFGAKRRITP